jgi:hypothetical protein
MLPEDHPERAVCVELADGYDRLAALLEQRGRRTTPGISSSAIGPNIIADPDAVTH